LLEEALDRPYDLERSGTRIVIAHFVSRILLTKNVCNQADYRRGGLITS
jgi:hypothetical protein